MPDGLSLIKAALESLPRLIQAGADTHPLLGYGLITLGMFLENLVPPIPAELIMPLGGFLAHKGQLQLLPVILSGLLGTVLGAWFWYGIGRLINEERLEHLIGRHGRWLGVTPGDCVKAAAGSTTTVPRLSSGAGLCPGSEPSSRCPPASS